ncbi:MAG: hypothetical protein ACOYNC_16060 [Bacteroidales bacterium]
MKINISIMEIDFVAMVFILFFIESDFNIVNNSTQQIYARDHGNTNWFVRHVCINLRKIQNTTMGKHQDQQNMQNPANPTGEIAHSKKFNCLGVFVPVNYKHFQFCSGEGFRGKLRYLKYFTQLFLMIISPFQGWMGTISDELALIFL